MNANQKMEDNVDTKWMSLYQLDSFSSVLLDNEYIYGSNLFSCAASKLAIIILMASMALFL